MSKYRILSIDGGGIRGVIPAIVFERLNATHPGWLDDVDLIAGTSTGGLLALGIARGLEPAAIRDLYVDEGPKIFDDSFLDDVLDLWKVIGADYQIGPLRTALKRVLGKDTTLGELEKRVLIPAFDLDNQDPDPAKRCWKPKLFHNFPGPEDDRDELAWKVGLYTSAAPTYFPSVDGYIDGGVYAENPSMCALAQSQDRRYMDPPPELEDIVLFSLGTGQSLHTIKGLKLDWGFAQWAKPIIEVMKGGVSGIADYQCRRMLGGRYARLAPTFAPDKSYPMDAIDRLPELIQFATDLDLGATDTWLDDNWA
jgi:hypothetical protein